MKKLLFILLAIGMSMTVWSQDPPTHTPSKPTLTIEVGTTDVLIQVRCANGNNCKYDYTTVKKDTVYIEKYQLEEGETYIIKINPKGASYEFANVYNDFTAWMRDGAVWSTSPELRLTMGKSDIYLTAVMTRKAARPYSPNANWFDPSTGVLTLDEIRNGSIYDAASTAMSRYQFEKDDVLSMVLIGELNSSVSLDDFHKIRTLIKGDNNDPLNNLLLIDLSQTSGMSILKGASLAEKKLPKLEHIVLGPGLDSVAGYSFLRLNINTIDCYAVTPPHCDADAFIYMNVPQKDVLVRVPPQSVELYRQAPGWKKFTNIQPLYETSGITVTLPTDVPEGYYEDMTVELTNLRSRFVQNRMVLNKREFLFGGQMRGCEYQAVLKNAYGQVTGQTASTELGEKDITLAFGNLLRAKDVTLKVTAPDGKDITGKVRVLWTDESDKALGYASRLKAVAEGAKLNCKISLMDELARQYVTPGTQSLTVDGEGENLLTVRLQPVQQLTIHGLVKDKQTGETIADASVALTQRQGENQQSVTATTDDEGRYELQGTNVQGELSVTAPGYLPKTLEFNAPASDGALPSVEMDPFNGVIVNTWFTYTGAAAEGTEGETTEGYDAYSDAAWQVYNQTKDAAVKDFIIKERALYFPSDVEPGDELKVTVSCHSNSFSPVSASCEIANSGLGYVTLPIVQKGCLEAVVKSAASNSVMGVLYDAEGRFVRSNTYKFAALSCSELAPGDYTLVSMTSNTLMRRVLLMSTLDDMGLKEGTDYVKNAVHIDDGKIVSVIVADVPALDMDKLRFTDPKTYFVANRNVISVGQYVVVKSKLSFAEQYAGRVGKVELMVDMPEGMDMVENSALTGSNACNYRIDEGHYVFPVENTGNDNLKLCLLPKTAGEFRVTGSVRFTLDGVKMVQPVGTVWIQAKGLTLNTPVFVAPATLQVSGTAPWAFRGGRVEVYDGDELVGKAKTDANGWWSVNIHFPVKKTPDRHAIKARMTTEETGAVESEVKYVAYSDNHVIAEKVVMVPPHSRKTVTFNYFDNTISQQSYTYILKSAWKEKIPYSTKFSFSAYFDDLDMSKTDKVKIRVLASDGTSRTLKAKYDAKRQCYYASSGYPNASKIPVSAYAYSEGEYSYSLMSEEEIAAMTEEKTKALKKITQVAFNAAEKTGEIEVLPDDGETLNLRCTVSGKDPLAFTLKEMDYDEAVTYTIENGPFVLRGDKGNMVFTFVNGTEEAEMIVIDVDEHYALRTVITDAEIDDLDAKSNKKPATSRKIKPINILTLMYNAGDNFLSFYGLKDYVNAPIQQTDMETKSYILSRAIQREIDAMSRMLDKSCVTGSFGKPRFSNEKKDKYNKQLDYYVDESNKLLDQLDENYEAFLYDFYRKVAFDLGTTVLGAGLGKAAAISAAEKLGPKAWPTINKIEDFLKTDAWEWIDSQLGFWPDLALSGLVGGIPSLNQLLSLDFDRHYKEYMDKIDLQGKSIINALKNLRQEMLDNMDECEENPECEGDDCDKPECEEDDCEECEGEDCEECEGEDCEEHNVKKYREPRYSRKYYSEYPSYPWPANPLIDPSGYVYEAVPSNRVEGATVTIWYKDFMLNQNGNSSGERDAMWDAENYEQVNPQTTGSDGMYQWDVPQGIWQVRVQKEGYEDNASEWLPVPPPQLDVNIPIVRARLPKVETAHAYEDAVTVKFDSYMLPALLTAEQITVKENGTAVEGVISLTDEEEAPDGATYASQLRFIPTTPFTATEVTLIVSGQVKNYAGIEMDEPYEAVLPIERELKSLEAAKKVYVEYQGTGTVRVKGTPAAAAAGKTVTVTCLSGIIASATQTEVVLDANGEADITIQGDLPGEEIVTFTLEDPALTTSTLVKVVTELPLVIEAPEASVATETEVAKGAEITLTCATEGAAIYFTLDGSSPLDSDTRILYDGTPIAINAETTLAAVAVIDGKGSSEVRTWHYTVSVETRTEEVSGGTMQVTPARVRDSFVVTGVEGVFSLRVYSMSGKLLLTLEQVRSGQRVDASALPAGIHLVVANTPSASLTRRIVKY